MKPATVSVTQSETGKSAPGKAEKKSGKRIGYNYIILKSLKESQKNDVVKCLYIKSLTNFGICVIKEGTYGDSKDKQGRDIKDRLLWQKQLHEALQYKIRLPRLLGSFEENGNYYLVLERIKGKSVYKACRDHSNELRQALITGSKTGMTFLDYMIQLTNLLDTLHRHQVVHRDVTATNFMITPSGKVAVIDMELSYSLQQQAPSPPFQLGTYGYMSPEQEVTATPAVEQDTFSLAAILLQMWTGISPIKLTNGSVEALEQRVKFFVPDAAFAGIIIQCLQPEAGKRPPLDTVSQVITAYRDDLKANKQRPLAAPAPFTNNQVMETVQQVIHTMATPLMADPEKGWFAENKSAPLNPDKKKINKAWYASFNRGAAGIIYMLSKAHLAGLDVETTRPAIQQGLDLIEKKYINNIDNATPGLHFGAAGIAASLAVAIQDRLIIPQSVHFDWISCLLERENTATGIMHGVAGQGIAYGLCAPWLHPDPVRERLTHYTHYLLGKQQKDGSWLRGNEKKNRVTRGFAHGVAGIVYYLLEYAQQYDNREALDGAVKGLRWLMQKAAQQKEAIQWKSSSNKDLAAWWCEGAPGIALTFLKAWTLLGETRYRDIAIGALRSQQPEVLDNNLSQCHGLSGLGEIYLEAHRVLKDDEWLSRANWIVQVLMHVRKQHIEHGPYWLVEHERQPVPEFMTGNSGILHFLVRYCNQERIGFPML